MKHELSITAITPVAHNVFSYDLEKPAGFTFEPGQAADVSIGKSSWRARKRPFTFTSLPEWDTLQFTAKTYHERGGVTDEMSRLITGDRLVVSEPFGAIAYKGQGVFIAGGTGITPFVPILRRLNMGDGHLAGHTLIFANRSERDIILREELDAMPGLAIRHILSGEEKSGYGHGRIDRTFLEGTISDFGQVFYLCGPDAMVDDISSILNDLGVGGDQLVVEK